MDSPLNGFKKVGKKLGKGINRFVENFDSEDPLMVLPYRGYANSAKVYLKGRVLEDENIFRGKTDSQVQNIINSFKRFETDEIPNADVRITCNNQSFECQTDAEGYFALDANWEAPGKSQTNSWLDVSVELLYPTKNNDKNITAKGEIYLPSENADYGIITDIDDTILQTHVTSLFKLKMLYATIFKNAHQRLPMEGMVELFKTFVKGANGKRENPIFYLSHSPWNIYDLLNEFLNVQKFPKGPLLLRDFGIYPSGDFSNHKTNRIAHILKTYPVLPFILLGDSAEKDADFYIKAARNFPDQIKAIYIRQTRNTKNAERIKRLINESTDVPAILIHSSKDIFSHGTENGLLM